MNFPLQLVFSFYTIQPNDIGEKVLTLKAKESVKNMPGL